MIGNIKCNQQNHHNEDKVAVCLKENCKHSRLLCWKCLTQFHIDHSQNILGFNDIQKNNFENWPIDENLRKIQKEFNCSSYDQIISSLESLFDAFTTKFLKELEIIKKQLIAKINFKDDNKLSNKLKTALENALNLTPIKEALSQVLNSNSLEKEIDFDNKINEFLSSNNQIRVKNASLINEIYPEWAKNQLILDENVFNEITQEIFTTLNKFSVVLRKPGPLIIKMEFSGQYIADKKVAGTNNFNDLKDESLMKGICAKTPGWIILEYNTIVTFKSIRVAGWHGDGSIWDPSNGSGAEILISLDSNKWVSVGNLPNLKEKLIQTIQFNSINAKFLKFLHNSYLGIGFLELLD